jgi:threonine synthase
VLTYAQMSVTGTHENRQPEGQVLPEGEAGCYVTILPEPHGYSVTNLPSLWPSQVSDVFATAVEDFGLRQAPGYRSEWSGGGENMYPYPTDLLQTMHHLRCGNATVYRSSSLEDLTGFELVLVLDMGSYYWSGTLKDPRSWAIINAALTYRKTDIAVWTAGNAGISLARLAYFANRRLPPEARLQIHCIVDNDVAPEIRAQLRLWQCEVLDVFRQDRPVLNPEEIHKLVASRLRRSRRRLDDASYWHVTDGWDGVGLLMYRLIAAQVIRDLATAFGRNDALAPLDIVLPIGTGDLFLGFYLGLIDCEDVGIIARHTCRLIGVLPAGANILGNIRQRRIPPLTDETVASSSPAPPVMPKLNSLYTPLAPCLACIDNETSAYFMVVTEADQLRAGRHILSGGIDDGIVAEPSALATFAALPHLDRQIRLPDEKDEGWRYQRGRRVLVVNSGFGVLGRREEMVLHRTIGM